MKRILILFAAVIAVLSMTEALCAASDYSEELLDGLQSAQTEPIEEGLSQIGIDPESPESVSSIKPEGLINYVSGLFKDALKRPAKIVVICVIIAGICRLATSLSYKAGLYGEIFVIICFIAVSTHAVDAFNSAVNAMRSCQAFMGAYIPAFAAIVASSGNITAAVSYNAIILYFCEAAALLATAVFRPVLCCMLVLSATQSLNPELSNLTSTVKNALTTLIGFVMTVFLGVLGLQTMVGRGVDGIAVRAGKYAVSSFVPIIGYSLSESYKAVSLSLSAIRTTVGVFGIVVMCLFMLSPIVTAAVYKFAFLFSGWLCRIIGANSIASLMSGLGDVFGFLSTVLTFFMLMLTVSTGMLILLGGVLQA